MSDGPFVELLRELYCNDLPSAWADARYVDLSFPFTNLKEEMVEPILRARRPRFWLELGSMHGGSAIVAAETARRLEIDTEVICVDPCCGDVNMWCRDYERSFMHFEACRPTIRERFLANVRAAGLERQILLLPVTSMVGMGILRRLHAEHRLSSLPDVVYLDSAHEAGETRVEIEAAYDILKPGGLLIGDDWNWQAVADDVECWRSTQDAEPPLKLVEQHWMIEKPL